ncbi:hypothetical protein SAMN06296010_1478 [Agreia pratensis]|uniref:Lipoprotein n=1 Tax=Agreia pratensis TaxID=150121 RepID=A0A1X7JL78_9MICO|nr:hypothetical protein SAMN06296010_1478 [Agreia pratensis]
MRGIGALASAGLLLSALSGCALLPSSDAQGAAQAYLDALSSGDGKAAQALESDPDASATAAERLDDATLRIADAHASVSGRLASISYSLGGTKVEARFTMSQQGGEWKVDDTLAQPLELPTGAGWDFTVGGTAAPAGGLSLYPGEYALTGPETDLFTTASQIEVSSNTSDKRASLEQVLAPTPAFEDLVENAVSRDFDLCASGEAVAPLNCRLPEVPDGFPAMARSSDVVTITSSPTRSDSGSFALGPMSSDSSAGGETQLIGFYELLDGDLGVSRTITYSQAPDGSGPLSRTTTASDEASLLVTLRPDGTVVSVDVGRSGL